MTNQQLLEQLTAVMHELHQRGLIKQSYERFVSALLNQTQKLVLDEMFKSGDSK